MKKIMSLTIVVLLAISANQAAAQFNIKIPKIGKPKTDQPKTVQNG